MINVDEARQALASMFSDARATLLDIGIQATATGPFDTKGTLHMVSRASSPPIFVWVALTEPHLRAFFGTATEPVGDVPVPCPLDFVDGRWNASSDEGAGLAEWLTKLFDWADNNVPPSNR